MDHQLTLVSRVDCHACETAEKELRRISEELNVKLTVVDVDADLELRAEFGDRVPVILVNGQEYGYGEVEEHRLRQALI